MLTGRDRDVEDMMKSVYSTFMVARNVMSLMTMVWTPFIQFKGFLLSFLGVLINLSRLVLQMRALDRMEHMQKKQTTDIEYHMPNRMSHHHPNKVKYIVRDYGDTVHQQNSHYQDLEHTSEDDHGSYWPANGDQADSYSSPYSQNPWESPPTLHHRPNEIKRYVSSDSYLSAAYRH